MNMPTAKGRFLSNESAARWMRDVVDNRWFQEACEAALLTYTQRFNDEMQPEKGYNRILGAQQFLNELMRIADERQKQTRTPPNDNLIQKA